MAARDLPSLAWVALCALATGSGCGQPRSTTAIELAAQKERLPLVAETRATKLEDLPRAPPPGATPAAGVILWLRDDAASLHVRSVWIETSSTQPGAPAWIAASRGEPVAVADGSMVGLRSEKVVHPTVPCESCPHCEGNPDAAVRATAVDLATGKVTPFTAPEPSGAPLDFEAGFEVHGLVGSVVFVSAHASTLICGNDHKVVVDRSFAYDVARATETTIGPSARQRAEAADVARPDLTGLRVACGVIGDFEPALDRTVVSFDRGLVPRTIYAFTAPAPYYCTATGRERVEVEVLRNELPESHPDFRAPPWIAHLLRESRVLGISNLVPAPAVETMRRVFRDSGRSKP